MSEADREQIDIFNRYAVQRWKKEVQKVDEKLIRTFICKMCNKESTHDFKGKKRVYCDDCNKERQKSSMRKYRANHKPKKYPHIFIMQKRNKAIELYKQGMSIYDISVKIGREPDTVKGYIK